MLSSGFEGFSDSATLENTGLYNYLGDLKSPGNLRITKTPEINFQLPTLPSQLNNTFHHAAFPCFPSAAQGRSPKWIPKRMAPE